MSAVFRSSWERLLGKTDSPIEGALLDAFCVLSGEYGYEILPRSGAREGVIVIKPQVQFGERYWADFLVSYHFFGADFTAVVECDGHDWHERTKQQAAHDRRRDRVCQRLGYRVFRFTGSEIRADPATCAFDLLDAIMQFQTSAFTAAIEQADLEAA